MPHRKGLSLNSASPSPRVSSCRKASLGLLLSNWKEEDEHSIGEGWSTVLDLVAWYSEPGDGTKGPFLKHQSRDCATFHPPPGSLHGEQRRASSSEKQAAA